MISYEDLKNELLPSGETAHLIPLQDIPAIDLYMDQVTSFMDEHLSQVKRHPEDKLLTKTMIHNYTKNRLLPPPEKKKYSREHVILLLFIYYLKDFMSISDIHSITEPLARTCFNPADDSPSVEEVYQDVLDFVGSRQEETRREIDKVLSEAGETFPDASPENADFLRTIALVGALSSDILVRKRLLERLVDQLAAETKAKDPGPEAGQPGERRKRRDPSK